MSKLTDEQIEMAAEQIEMAAKSAWTAGGYCGEWPNGLVSATTTDSFRTALRTAAPYLQLPWEPPTTVEIDRAREYFSTASTRLALEHFVSDRNAALLPKPDMKRVALRNAVNEVINKYKIIYDRDRLIDELVDALDEAK
jgi:hypothetical protein